MRAEAALLSTLLLCGLAGCATGGRMVRGLPFWGKGDLPDTERVNAWPLYYQADDFAAVLWPIFDVDDEGFALRPIVAKDGTEWSVLFPLSAWNTESGNWRLLSAYETEDNRGFLPFFNLGDEWNHVALAWWVKGEAGDVTDWGLWPLFGKGEVNHVGPVWWAPGEGDAGGFGLFPLAYFDEQSGYVVPAWWSKDEQGGLEELGVLPLFHYRNTDGYERLITPLGGRSWGGDGERKFVNVLGPVFHHSTNGEQRYTAVAWPIFALERDGEETGVRVFPLFAYEGSENASSLSMLAGLIGRGRNGENESLRVAPLFSHNEGLPPSLWDFFTLYGYRESAPTGDLPEGSEAPPDVSVHVGTPLVFNYRRRGDETEWGSLLNVLDYEASGDESRFSFLYYLYRQQRKGEQVRRDFFPFVTWDSGPEKSGFSFLWRIFRWESAGEATRGHFLFIPWGDHSEPEAVTGP